MSKKYFSGWDDKTIMADVDVNGNSLELTIEGDKVKAIGNIPVGGGDESVWTDETFNALGDDDGDNILDENNEAIGDEDAETLWTSRDGVGFKAKRAEADINGNSLELHVNAEGKIDKIGDKYIEGTGEAPVDAYSKEETNALLDDKVDKVSGKGLSANDYTNADKDKLDNIESGAEVNLIESVKVDGSALTIDANKAVDIPLASATASGNETVYVTGVVTGQDKQKWDDWTSSNITIPLPKDTIEVKGHLFKYVQIGNLLVTTENLDIPLGTVGTDCFWYDDDEDTNRDLGMLYKFSALGSFQNIDYYHSNEFVPTQEVYDCIYAQGWRIWTDSDWNTIIQAHVPSGGLTQDGLKNMCATSGWKGSTQGANTLGLNLPPSGEKQWDGTAYSYKGTYFIARTIYTPQTVNRISPTSSITGVGNLNTGASIRLVKDVTE